MEKVTVIIPTYNRFKYLLNSIDSIKNQTYQNIEIIVVNDCSTEENYYTFDFKERFGDNLMVIHLPKNSRKIFDYPCAGYVRNKGIEKSTGRYIAFCDDYDIWFPQKIEIQIKAMKKAGCKMSSTDGLIGRGVYDKNKKYKKYNAEYYFRTLQNRYKRRIVLIMDFIWTYDLLNS